MRSLRIASLTDAAREFLRHNDETLSAADHGGVTWEPVRERYGVREGGWLGAFKACCRKVDGRWTWAAVDVALLRECVPGLILPPWVNDEMAARAWADEAAAGAWEGWADAEQARWYEGLGEAEDDGWLDADLAKEILDLARELISGTDPGEISSRGVLGADSECLDVTEEMIVSERPALVLVPREIASPPALPAWAWRAA